jgi:tellurite resistance protein TehA-like permease
LLYNFPYGAGWLQRLGITIFILNILIFVVLSIGHIARYIRFKGLFTASILHTTSGMFWGTLPMGLVTIVVSLM